MLLKEEPLWSMTMMIEHHHRRRQQMISCLFLMPARSQLAESTTFPSRSYCRRSLVLCIEIFYASSTTKASYSYFFCVAESMSIRTDNLASRYILVSTLLYIPKSDRSQRIAVYVIAWNQYKFWSCGPSLSLSALKILPPSFAT